jgi:NAD(P)H dehydrogenase (quinone)
VLLGYLDSIPSMVGPDGVIRGPGATGGSPPCSRTTSRRPSRRCSPAMVTTVAPTPHPSRGVHPHPGRRADEPPKRQATRVPRRDRRGGLRLPGARRRAELGAGWVSSHWAIRERTLEDVSSDVRELTAREPVSLTEFLEAHRTLWRAWATRRRDLGAASLSQRRPLSAASPPQAGSASLCHPG